MRLNFYPATSEETVPWRKAMVWILALTLVLTSVPMVTPDRALAGDGADEGSAPIAVAADHDGAAADAALNQPMALAAAKKKGWSIENGKLYYRNGAGKLVRSKKVDGITLTQSGAAKMDTAAKLKIKVMKKIRQLTKPQWSKRKKLAVLFRYCCNVKRKTSDYKAKDIGKPGWIQKYALRALTTRKTECTGKATAFASFAYELGCKVVLYEHRNGHAYVMADGKCYDSEVMIVGGKARKFRPGYTMDTWHFTSWSTVKKGKKATKAPGTASAKTSVKKSSKKGLVKTGGSYYYFKNGKAVAKKWMTIKGARYYFTKSGKAATGSVKIGSRYYVFSATGKLCKGKKTRTVKVSGKTYRVAKNGVAKPGWTSSKKTLYLADGQRAEGFAVYKDKAYVFNGKGVLDNGRTQAVRKAAVTDHEASALVALLGSPLREYAEVSCYFLDGMTGEDVTYEYAHGAVNFFKGSDGKLYFIDFTSL